MPHTVISDTASGHLMQHGRVDMAITGADRVTSTGDVVRVRAWGFGRIVAEAGQARNDGRRALFLCLSATTTTAKQPAVTVAVAAHTVQ